MDGPIESGKLNTTDVARRAYAAIANGDAANFLAELTSDVALHVSGDRAATYCGPDGVQQFMRDSRGRVAEESHLEVVEVLGGET